MLNSRQRIFFVNSAQQHSPLSSTHIQFKHTDVLPAMLPILEKFKDKKSPGDGNNFVRDDGCIDVEIDTPGLEFATKSFEKVASTEMSSRRGQNQRKSYTIEFKVQTLKLLDALTERKIKNKWQKCALERGIPNKSMVIKWNKERSKIFAEASLNRQRENNGNIKVSRQ